MTERLVQVYAGERLAKYKALDGGVKFRPFIPRSPAGKIQKRIFQSEAREEVLAEQQKSVKAGALVVHGNIEPDRTSHHPEPATDGRDGVLTTALVSIVIEDAPSDTTDAGP